MRPLDQCLILRADAGPQIGTGHLMRCLALAQTWQDAGGNAIFAMAMEAPALEARLKSEGMEVAHLPAQPGSADDAAQTASLARQMKASWVVVDGYHFGADYQRMIKDSGLRLLATDDNGHADHYYADIVLNQNLHAHEGLYANREPYTRLLLGPQYVLLRREFCKWRGWKRESPEVARRVLVTLGGSDPDNVTGKVIQALPHVKVEGLEAVVVGASNPHYQKLQSVAQDSRIPIRLASHATNMPELMARADAAIAGGGCTSWELAFMGLPGVILTLADNQRPVAEGLEAAGVAVSLGKGTNLTPTKITQVLAQLLVAARVRAEMARRGQALVDGEGANRALSWMQEAEEDGRRLTADRCQSTGGLRSSHWRGEIKTGARGRL